MTFHSAFSDETVAWQTNRYEGVALVGSECPIAVSVNIQVTSVNTHSIPFRYLIGELIKNKVAHLQKYNMTLNLKDR